uniref:Uncharacterized protein n=1 Tax=Timema cristinae TaxID=61476 RepID=A0A7R9D139_TIMCR|nr:unnamed protein product [Timema cristinae]
MFGLKPLTSQLCAYWATEADDQRTYPSSQERANGVKSTTPLRDDADQRNKKWSGVACSLGRAVPDESHLSFPYSRGTCRTWLLPSSYCIQGHAVPGRSQSLEFPFIQPTLSSSSHTITPLSVQFYSSGENYLLPSVQTAIKLNYFRPLPLFSAHLKEELPHSVPSDPGKPSSQHPQTNTQKPLESSNNHESLRKHPPVMFLRRQCTKLFEFKNGAGKVCRIEPKTSIIIPTYAIHNDPKYYQDPEIFDPERNEIWTDTK